MKHPNYQAIQEAVLPYMALKWRDVVPAEGFRTLNATRTMAMSRRAYDTLRYMTNLALDYGANEREVAEWLCLDRTTVYHYRKSHWGLLSVDAHYTLGWGAVQKRYNQATGILSTNTLSHSDHIANPLTAR